MWRHIASNFLTVSILILIAAAAAVAWGQRQYTQAGPLTGPICFRVEPNTSFTRAAGNLAEAGAITSEYIFRTGADYESKTDELKAGAFLLPEGASMAEIVSAVTTSGRDTCGTQVVFRIGILDADIRMRQLNLETLNYVEVARFDALEGEAPAEYVEFAQDDSVEFRIVLAEGVTSWQVNEALKRADFLTGEVEEVPAEGTLAPDSYEVRRGADRAQLFSRMQERQTIILADAWGNKAEDVPYASPEEALIMASIVEKETAVADERRQVASVFVNRIRQGMRLQTDPTVIYGVTQGRGSLGRGLRQSELRGETPYNTYIIDGLPPTPIANPGRAAIEAALNPDTTDYLFFVADGTGGHAFAETLTEHNENVARWREIEAERQNSD